ncbi:MAG: ABC transporter ATP-binding protein [Solirubrobacteraceae bacterium]|nr:ABC transporter ATP-binding protein [Solirubrobacteraceae bacterium]
MSEPALAVRDLTVAYGPVPVVRNLSLEIAAGEVVGLIGPNGAGKTTTLLAIMGDVSARGGDVRLAGRSLRGQGADAIVRSGVALVPEGRHVFGDMTVAENLKLGLVGRRSEDGLEGDLEWVHSLFPIVREFGERQAGALSGGQQQQLAIARALLAQPEVLLLDEPSLGLAPTVVDIVFEALQAIRERGVTILLVEQRAQRTIAFADRTYVMRDGAVRMTLTPDDADATETIREAYFGS